MSTKTGLRDHRDPESGTSFYLYTDWLDECAGLDVVNLRLEGVPFEASCSAGGQRVELVLPRALAGALGLVPPEPRPFAASDAGRLRVLSEALSQYVDNDVVRDEGDPEPADIALARTMLDEVDGIWAATIA